MGNLDKPAKPFPRFDSDEAAERFVAEADLSQHDFSGFRPMKFEIAGAADSKRKRPARPRPSTGSG